VVNKINYFERGGETVFSDGRQEERSALRIFKRGLHSAVKKREAKKRGIPEVHVKKKSSEEKISMKRKKGEIILISKKRKKERGLRWGKGNFSVKMPEKLRNPPGEGGS